MRSWSEDLPGLKSGAADGPKGASIDTWPIQAHRPYSDSLCDRSSLVQVAYMAGLRACYGGMDPFFDGFLHGQARGADVDHGYLEHHTGAVVRTATRCCEGLFQ